MRSGDDLFLIDWEDAGDGLPDFDDLFHFLVQGHALLGHPSEHDLLEAVCGRGWLAPLIESYAEGAGLGCDDIPQRFEGYLTRTSRWGAIPRASLLIALGRRRSATAGTERR